jgi:hypothetical protein
MTSSSSVKGTPVFRGRGKLNFPTLLRIGLVGKPESGLEVSLAVV